MNTLTTDYHFTKHYSYTPSEEPVRPSVRPSFCSALGRKIHAFTLTVYTSALLIMQLIMRPTETPLSFLPLHATLVTNGWIVQASIPVQHR